MANFRNKQWFKELSDEKKEALCKQFNCTLKGLKKAGYIGEDGSLKIDLLRLDSVFPEKEWKKYLDVFESGAFKTTYSHLSETEELEEILKDLEALYALWNPDIKFLKPDLKKSCNNLWIRQCKLLMSENIKDIEWYKEHIEDPQEKKEAMMCDARKVYYHLESLFKTELNNIKK